MIEIAQDEGNENYMSEIDNLLQQVAKYGQVFSDNNDEERLDKTRLFAKKLIENEYTISFAGHFSAGKSSMINALTGEDLLPSSPIPTSANIVKIKKTDADYAIIHLTDGTAVKYGGHGFPAAIKSFSKDGAAVSQVEIGHTASKLPKGITVMDTPGVDSTDDAHRLSTESALHLADLVFYTMDYNHVQSEINFRFTKDLMRYNDNIYLIINQIDKHRESELPFEAFKKTVEDSFELWGVKPKGIFYTSLKNLEHQHNDFTKVKEIVDGSIENWYENFVSNAKQTLLKLKDEHTNFLKEEVAERKNVYSTIVDEEEWTKLDGLKMESVELTKMLSLVSGDGFSVEFEKNRNSLLENSAITPYETRELLKSYLESLSSRFKVGILFSAKKTAEEQFIRKAALATNISELVHTHIEIHLKNLMKSSLKEAGVLSDERSLAIDAMNMKIPFEEIEKDLNVGDVITGDTVLNYSERMKSIILTRFRRLTDDWKHGMALIISKSGNEKSGELEQKLRKVDEKIKAIHLVNEMEQCLTRFLNGTSETARSVQEGSQKLLEKWSEVLTLQQIEFELPGATNDEIASTEQADEAILSVEMSNTTDAKEISEYALQIGDAVSGIPGFKEAADYLKRKAKRLENQELTVALFGAFSAGKSSFTNALIGENVLPVSPNPTTATINRIRPISSENQDGTADVLLKTTLRMTEDVVRSFEMLGIKVNSLELAFAKVEEALAVDLSDEKMHVHKSFISAFKKGFPLYRDSLGQVISVNREEFVKFVAEEERSCFVESIDFFYDCELTRQGITLVDTPGADSINARHTDVAFDYIRNADAILFVTYYNHAFARADREFLVQLGRVKDAFEMDKMFFIVNAIDLATNSDEAEEVKTFVENELQKFGIRNPRVHGISSLEALEAKVAGIVNPQMERFEEEFHHFLEYELKGIAVKVLEDEIGKVIERMASFISRTEQNKTRKAERLIELNKLEGEIRQHFTYNFAEVLTRTVQNELGELIYYLLQRVFLCYPDFFREAYNPAVFVNRSVDTALKGALAETVQMIGFDLTQELKVTNLRMLNFMKKQLTSREKTELKILFEFDSSIAPSPYETKEVDLLNFQTPFEDLTGYMSVNRLFKNVKSFFEKGEKDILREHLESVLKHDSSLYLGNQKEHIEKWADQWIESEAEGLRQHLLKESLNQIESERTSLGEEELLEEWRAVYAKIQTGRVI